MAFFDRKVLLESNFGIDQVRIMQKGSIRSLYFSSEGMQGAVDVSNPDWAVFPYQRAFWLIRTYKSDVRSFLSLGVGSGTAMRSMRYFYPDSRLVGVDLDQVVVESALRWFMSPTDAQSRYIIQDAEDYLVQDRQFYDVIFLDIYNAIETPIRFKLAPFFQLLRRRLSDDGILAINVIDRPTSWRRSFRDRVEMLQEYFEWVDVVPTLPIPFAEQNIMIFAGAGVRNEVEYLPRQNHRLYREISRWRRRIHTC